MTPKILTGILIFTMVLALGGCCTTTSTDPKAVGWCDLVGPGRQRLDDNLAARRADLRAMQEQASKLEYRLNQKEKALDNAAKKIKQAEHQSGAIKTEQAKLLQQIEARKIELNNAQSRLNSLNSEAAQIEASLQKNAAEQQRQEAVKNEINGLEREIVSLERTINDLLSVQAKNAVMNSQ